MIARAGKCLIPVMLASAGVVQAEGLYMGAKAGFMDVDDSAFDEATNVGAVIGYEFADQGAFSWAVEGELTTTSSDGDVGASGEWDIDTQAVYGVARIGGDVYAKFKIGFLNEDVSASGPGGSFDGSDSGLSAGIGVGWRSGRQFGLEAEYTQIEEDVSFISLGVNVFF